jgi:hypothetical protein
MEYCLILLSYFALNSSGQIGEQRIRYLHNDQELQNKLSELSKPCDPKHLNRCLQFTGSHSEYLEHPVACKPLKVIKY